MKFVDRIINRITDSCNYIMRHLERMDASIDNGNKYMQEAASHITRKIDDMATLNKIVEEQTNIIDALLFHGGVSDEVQIFVFKTYRGSPIIYLNGEKLNTERAKKATIWLEHGEYPNVDIENW